jgi:hypothetical protein
LAKLADMRSELKPPALAQPINAALPLRSNRWDGRGSRNVGMASGGVDEGMTNENICLQSRRSGT